MRERFQRACPGVFFLDAADPEGLASYLQDRGWLDPDEKILALDSAGEGNMNLTLRLKSARRSLIIKQARPWVEKYPEYDAPRDRALVEGAYFKIVQENEALAALSPKLLGQDEETRLLVLEDLGEAQDLSAVYADGRIDADLAQRALDYLRELHGFTRRRELPPILVNRDMRALNHTHIFDLPLRPDNGLDLDAFTPGLAELATRLTGDSDFVARVRGLGERYLSDGPVLVHGDFYPGSLLKASRGLAVIDAEFCFPGFPEFDHGVFLGHLTLAGVSDESQDEVLDAAVEAGGDPFLILRIAGVEVMRRLLGVAQLPLPIDLEAKALLLEQARARVMV